MPISKSSALHATVDEIIGAAASPDPLAHIEAALGAATNRFHASGVLVHEEDDDEVLLHAGPHLTIYHITLSPGLQYPPHNHLMDAVIGIYKGGETNFVYPVSDGKLGRPERRDLSAPALLHLPAHTVHSVANSGRARSGAIHVYLGDLLHVRRQLWDLQGKQAEPFDNDRYLAGARRMEGEGT